VSRVKVAVARHQSKEAKRFIRASGSRFEEADFLLERSDYTTAAVYLAGYAVECILKALILVHEPKVQNLQTVASFRGQTAHSFEWLKVRLAERHVLLPPAAAKALSIVASWTTNLRYDPSVIRRGEAEQFVKAAGQLLDWAKGRL